MKNLNTYLCYNCGEIEVIEPDQKDISATCIYCGKERYVSGYMPIDMNPLEEILLDFEGDEW